MSDIKDRGAKEKAKDELRDDKARAEAQKDRAERERQEAEERFYAVFDVNPAPAIIVRLMDERIMMVNSGFAELTGYAQREVRGEALPQLDLFSDPRQREALLNAPRTWQQASKVEAGVKTKSGLEKTVLISAKPLELDGDTCGILTFADITAQKEVEVRLSTMFHVAPVPACMLQGRRIIEVNKSFLTLTGFREEEVLKRSGAELGLWQSEADRASFAAHLASGHGFRELALQIRTKTGDTRDVLASAEVLSDAERRAEPAATKSDAVEPDIGPHATKPATRKPGTTEFAADVLLMFYDVTERQRTERQLVQAIEEVMSDTAWLSRSVMEKLALLRSEGVDTAAVSGLTKREREVLERLAQGLDNTTIAQDLGIAKQTVRNYITQIYEKIGVHSRAEAVVWARERGLASF